MEMCYCFSPLREASLLPRPQRADGSRLLIGGDGPRRTLPLVARYADEWNAAFIPAWRFIFVVGTPREVKTGRGRRAAGDAAMAQALH